MADHGNAYTHVSISATFARTALPIILFTSVNGLLTVVDAIFLGAFVGADALTAVTMVFPVSMLMIALATMVSSGMGVAMLVRTKVSPRPVDGLLALAGEQIFCSKFKYRKGMVVFGEGEEAEYVYQITTGAVRTYKLLPDGRRQINSFHLPGDLFGLENSATRRFTAEAIVETNVRITRQRSLHVPVSQAG